MRFGSLLSRCVRRCSPCRRLAERALLDGRPSEHSKGTLAYAGSGELGKTEEKRWLNSIPVKDSKALTDTIGLEEDFLGRSLLLLSPHGGYRGIQRHSRGNIPPHSRRCLPRPLHLLFSLRFAELCHCTSTRSEEKANKAEFCSGDCM